MNEGKKTNFPPWQTKCWKRCRPINNRFSTITGDEPVCRAFEQVLNTTCEPPKKLECDWALPPGEKRFEKLGWVQVDPKEYWGLIKDLNVSCIRDDLREELWKTAEPQERKAIDRGERRLSVTTVDIDQDGHGRQLVRYDLLPCRDTPGSIFGVMVPETKRLDWRYEAKLSKVNGGNEGAEIMLYQGKVYKFGWRSGWNFLFIWNEKNNNICRFEYLKGGT